MSSFFSKERIVAEEGFNRWRVPPASIAIHLCIGSVYAWSIYKPCIDESCRCRRQFPPTIGL